METNMQDLAMLTILRRPHDVLTLSQTSMILNFSRHILKTQVDQHDSARLDMITGWWFGTFFIFPYIGNNHPN